MSEGLKKACILLSSLEEGEAKEVMGYLTNDEKAKIKEGANLVSEEKTDFILYLVGEENV
ncbi:MAG: hypothetical protein AB1630_05080 [bacterium]